MDERTRILQAIKESGNNISKAARILGCSRRTLQNRMREYGMQEGTPGRRHRRLPYGSSGGKALAVAGGLAAAAGLVFFGGRFIAKKTSA